MKILITGGSGFLGTALTNALKTNGIHGESVSVSWVSRSPASYEELEKSKNIADNAISYDELATTNEIFDIIINLAGAGIADKRWTDERKKQLFDSRLRPTQAVIDYIKRISVKPKLFISGSAIGWYGVQSEADMTALDESHTPIFADFSHELCEAWEKLALSVQSILPVAIVRTGVVLSPEGGMLTRLLTPFKLGLGGKLGTGEQVMSWISREDWVRAVMFIISSALPQPLPDGGEFLPHRGRLGGGDNPQIYNLTAPTPISNLTFTKTLGQWLHRPTFFTLPRFLLKLLLGEMATLLIDGQKVVPRNLLERGFTFKHLTMIEALEKP